MVRSPKLARERERSRLRYAVRCTIAIRAAASRDAARDSARAITSAIGRRAGRPLCRISSRCVADIIAPYMRKASTRSQRRRRAHIPVAEWVGPTRRPAAGAGAHRSGPRPRRTQQFARARDRCPHVHAKLARRATRPDVRDRCITSARMSPERHGLDAGRSSRIVHGSTRTIQPRSTDPRPALGGERVHEGRVLCPQLLLAHGQRGIPRGATPPAHGEERGHQGNKWETGPRDAGAASGAMRAAASRTARREYRQPNGVAPAGSGSR